jgi:hypothetical protein
MAAGGDDDRKLRRIHRRPRRGELRRNVARHFGTTDPATVTWTATQSAGAVSGPALVTINIGPGVQFTGDITGTVVNGRLVLTLTVPAGAIPGVPQCSISGTTTTIVASATRIEADVVTTFSSACVGTVTEQPTSTAQLRMTRD